jgi:hypothetical protein
MPNGETLNVGKEERDKRLTEEAKPPRFRAGWWP